jgi:hypothetical protein
MTAMTRRVTPYTVAGSRTANERRHVPRAAVACMELDDGEAERAVSRLPAGLESLNRYLVERRSEIRE